MGYAVDVIEKLRACTQIDIQADWLLCAENLPVEVATTCKDSNWSPVELNAKGYITWQAGRQERWLSQRLVIPKGLQGYPLAGLALRLVLTWWAESAQVFVNGQLVQEGDLFDSSARVLLSSAVVPGEEITVALRLVSPGHDIGALMRSRCIYESTNSIDPGFVADELTVLQKYLAAFEPEKLDSLAAAMAEINWDAVSQQEEFTRELSTLRQNLQSIVGTRHTASLLKQRRIQMLGHAHLDMAWLWTVSETWEVAQRTFESVLNLQQEFPDLTYCHSTPALYAWIEQHRPDLFSAIKQQIAAGRWEVVGGMWVEPELNLIQGESIIRQVLYAQRYVQEKFGQLTTVAWVPDSFGFCWQLPQILKQGGIEYFVTQKLHWNDTTKFPYGVFWWRSPDGSQILSLMSPPNTAGVMDTNPLAMASCAIDWETQTNLKDTFWLPGVGDHGGGPTRDMLQVAQRWQQSPFFPSLEFTTAHDYLQALKSQLAEKQENTQAEENNLNHHSSTKNTFPIPVWNDELYLEFHRGCYTTHPDQKRWNRRCEGLLYQAELFASLATLTSNSSYPQILHHPLYQGGNKNQKLASPLSKGEVRGVSTDAGARYEYPKTQLEDAWKKVLFNQFHDILPGTSIPEVFVEANQAWQEVEQVSLKILDESLRVIASQITLPPRPQPDAQPLIVFNPLNWQRSELVTVSLPATTAAAWEIYDASGQKIPSQLSETSTLLFLAKDIPSVGYRLFWLCPTRHSSPTTPYSPADWVLENEFLRVVVDPKTGDLSSVFDKIYQREVLSGSGNQLQAFQDKGQYWDAWNIDPNYAQYLLPPAELKSIEWLETGELRSRLRVVRQIGRSQFYQEYILSIDSPILKIATTVDWQERHILVKAAFPLNLDANYATYEIPCGAIQRPTRPQTPAEQAKWEVPALRWADLGDEEYGVSLLNDCKYGYDVQPSQLRLTLLRSPSWPDPEADRGIHHFTYALYPHSGSWQSAATVRRGYELNLPLQVLLCAPSDYPTSTKLPAIGRLLDLQAENLVLIAFKQSEDTPQQWILRCYECHGESAKLSLESELGLSIAHPVDLLEQPIETSEFIRDGRTFSVSPWKIATFTVRTYAFIG